MVQEYIEIRGARENNLKDVSLRLPKRNITIFTGVSGSGKSSMVFDPIANEAQRLLFENFSMFIRNLLPRYPQPDADAIENLSMAVIVDQKRLGGSSHSTVGTVTDIASVLRLLFSRIGKPYVGFANALSFNDPQGMCLECNGLVRKLGPCPLCKGARLNQAALSSRINGYNIADLSAMEVDELLEVVKDLKDPAAAPIVRTLTERLQHLVDIGLEYLSLDRVTDTLSGGESQRVKIVKNLNGSLVDVMYIFDELSVGLHPRDVHRLNELLDKLRDKGNTVIVVEHDPDVIKVADYLVDMGPRAGSEGGQVVYEGDFAGLLKADTLTGNHLLHKRPLKETFRQASGVLS